MLLEPSHQVGWSMDRVTSEGRGGEESEGREELESLGITRIWPGG